MKENVYYLKDIEDVSVAIKHLARNNLYSSSDVESLQREFWRASEFSGTRAEAFADGVSIEGTVFAGAVMMTNSGFIAVKFNQEEERLEVKSGLVAAKP